MDIKYYFVDSINGNDENSGLSIEAPKKSITKEMLKESSADNKVVVYIKRGTTVDISNIGEIAGIVNAEIRGWPKTTNKNYIYVPQEADKWNDDEANDAIIKISNKNKFTLSKTNGYFGLKNLTIDFGDLKKQYVDDIFEISTNTLEMSYIKITGKNDAYKNQSSHGVIKYQNSDYVDIVGNLIMENVNIKLPKTVLVSVRTTKDMGNVYKTNIKIINSYIYTAVLIYADYYKANKHISIYAKGNTLRSESDMFYFSRNKNHFYNIEAKILDNNIVLYNGALLIVNNDVLNISGNKIKSEKKQTVIDLNSTYSIAKDLTITNNHFISCLYIVQTYKVAGNLRGTLTIKNNTFNDVSSVLNLRETQKYLEKVIISKNTYNSTNYVINGAKTIANLRFKEDSINVDSLFSCYISNSTIILTNSTVGRIFLYAPTNTNTLIQNSTIKSTIANELSSKISILNSNITNVDGGHVSIVNSNITTTSLFPARTKESVIKVYKSNLNVMLAEQLSDNQYIELKIYDSNVNNIQTPYYFLDKNNVSKLSSIFRVNGSSYSLQKQNLLPSNNLIIMDDLYFTLNNKTNKVKIFFATQSDDDFINNLESNVNIGGEIIKGVVSFDVNSKWDGFIGNYKAYVLEFDASNINIQNEEKVVINAIMELSKLSSVFFDTMPEYSYKD